MRCLANCLRAIAVACVIVPAALAQQNPQDTDYFKQAGNFFQNCDARKNDAGERPEANYLCLSFMAGMIEGYTYAAVANGNGRPYCLPRPVSLVEMMDMMTTVIERGVPPDLPTAAVFHFILTANFPCDAATSPDAAGTPELAPADGGSAPASGEPAPAEKGATAQ